MNSRRMDNNMKKRILTRLGITNFFLSLFIVFHHAFTIDINFLGTFNPLVYGLGGCIQRYLYNLSECAVPIFYFFSAYFFFRGYDGSWFQYRKKIGKRFFSLFIPHVVFCTFGYVKHLLASGMSGGVIGWLVELYECQTMPLWFIRELMALALLAPCFYWLKKRWLFLSLIILIIVILVTMEIVHYRSFVYWIPVYMLGANMQESWWDNINNIVMKYRRDFIILIVLYMIGCWFLPNGMRNPSSTINLLYVFFRIVTPIIYIPVLIYLTNSSIKVYKWMNYSFFVYCIHFPMITIVTLVFDKTFSPFAHFELVKFLFIIVATYTICVLMAMFCQRYIPKVWSVINGRR